MSDPTPAERTDGHAEAAAARALFGPWFWVMLALAVLCITAGGLVGFAGARLFPSPERPRLVKAPIVPRASKPSPSAALNRRLSS